jgi:uncharacterized integral membrane protein
MKNKTIWILVLVALFAVLLIQNSQLATMRFFFWPIYAAQFILVFFIFLIGFIVGFLAAKSGRKKAEKKEEHVPPPAFHQPPAKPQS